MINLDSSGDPTYDALTSKLEARLLARGTAGRSVEENDWVAYRVRRRVNLRRASPSRPDDVGALVAKLRGEDV